MIFNHARVSKKISTDSLGSHHSVLRAFDPVVRRSAIVHDCDNEKVSFTGVIDN